jgi:uncharacterized DUF497 family protein
MLDAPEFDWDDSNRSHLGLHKITPEETEQAILDPFSVLLEIQINDEEERTKVVRYNRVGSNPGCLFYISR